MRQVDRIVAFAMAMAMATAIPSAGQSEPKDVRFQLQNGYLIVVKGSIGELKNLSFVVDTGSYRTVLDERIARKLHLRSARSAEDIAPNHILEMDGVLIPQLTWGGITVASLNALVFDLSPISRYTGIHEDLVLGLDILHQASFQIDFRSRRIHFGGNQEPENSIPFMPNVPYLIVETSIDGHSDRLLVDTGTDSLSVFADRLPNDGQLVRTVGMGRDIIGAFPFTRLAAKQVLLGNSEVCGAAVFSIPAIPESRFDGSLAPRVLGASKIYFDFERWRFGWDKRKGHSDQCAPFPRSAESVASTLNHR